jgi:hypothetical protein
LANEHDGEISFDRLRRLTTRVKQLDPERLVTVSRGSDIPKRELRQYLRHVYIDFITPHRLRSDQSVIKSEARTKKYFKDMRSYGRIVPLLYQEPFRVGYDKFRPTAQQFAQDLKGAIAGGAAGWLFHNGDQRNPATPNREPRRSHDLSVQRLFVQFDTLETEALTRMHAEIPTDLHSEPPPMIRNNLISRATRFLFRTRKPFGYTQRGTLCDSILGGCARYSLWPMSLPSSEVIKT